MRGAGFLGGGQEVFALAGPLGGQHRVAAGDQPLAGEIPGGDLREVLLIEQRQLQRAVFGHQLADGGGAQRGDPPVGAQPGGSVPSPAAFRAAIRALVIMPRSPTMTIRARANFSRTTCTMPVNAARYL